MKVPSAGQAPSKTINFGVMKSIKAELQSNSLCSFIEHGARCRAIAPYRSRLLTCWPMPPEQPLCSRRSRRSSAQEAWQAHCSDGGSTLETRWMIIWRQLHFLDQLKSKLGQIFFVASIATPLIRSNVEESVSPLERISNCACKEFFNFSNCPGVRVGQNAGAESGRL